MKDFLPEFHIVFHTKKNYNIQFNTVLSHDVASGSEIMSCNEIDKLLAPYRFSETL